MRSKVIRNNCANEGEPGDDRHISEVKYWNDYVFLQSQKAALESVMLGGVKRILGCSSKTCNEAVRGDMGLETLQGRRDKSKLKVWYKLASMSEDRYPRRVFSQDWDAKPRRGRQRKVWSRLVDNLR